MNCPNDMGLSGPGLIRERRLQLAFFSPLPPAPTGVADYCWQLLPHLAPIADITLFVPDPAEIIPEVGRLFKIRPVAEFGPSRMVYDLALYQMGNSQHHEFVYQQALRFPGLVVLHDYYLHHLLATINGGDEAYGSYVRELGYELGQPGVDLAWDVRYGRRPYPLFTLPLNNRLVDHSLGFIVHSETAAGLLKKQQKQRPVGVVPLMTIPRAGHSRRSMLPPALGVTTDSTIFASTGQVTASKRLDIALQAFARLLAIKPQSRYLIIGQVAAGYDLDGLIGELGLAKVVHRTGYVSGRQSFADWTATADVIVNLRQPTLGESSAAVLQAMAAGRPTIVLDHGWYSELPEGSCIQVPPQGENALFEAMLSLAENRERGRKIGQNAVNYVKSILDPASCAALYGDFIEYLLAGINEKYQVVEFDLSPN